LSAEIVHPLEATPKVKCYCGFTSETEHELMEHIIKTHGARDGDWKGWVSKY
jgi:hypothetical protein